MSKAELGDSISLKVINDTELLKLFNDLIPSLQNSIVINGMKEAASIILNQAKSNFNSIKKGKSKTGYKEINKGFKIEKKAGGDFGVKLGNKYYKSRFIDMGTKERFYKTKNGKEHFTGGLQPTNFFKNAVDSKKQEAQDMVSECIMRSLDKTIKKYEKV